MVNDVTVADVDIPAGAVVTVCLGVANRDETHFEEPDAYNLHRSERTHLGFASGPHMCLGMHLARRELALSLTI